MKRLAFFWVVVAQALAASCGAATGTALFDAVRAGEVDTVKALLQADPTLVEARTEDGSTALHLAALEGQAAIAQLLVASHAQVNARGLRKETPLHMAMYGGHREVAELLLANQADVNAQNTAGETPLHLAARKGYRELVELLLSQKADLAARDKSGRTPKAVAAEQEHWAIVELLTPHVGAGYDLQRFVFEGARTFPAASLREALKGTPGFVEISDPFAPQEAYLEAIERRLLLGYQHHGFPEAQIVVRPDARAGRMVVTVVEGPRYVCGEVKVSGATNVPPAAIVERLMPSRTTTQSGPRAFVFIDQAPATNPLTETATEESDPSAALWVKGQPAPFSIVDLRLMKTQVTEALHARGFVLAQANVLVVPDKTAGTAALQVEVIEEGPRGVIDRIEVLGNKKNSTEAVLRYLDLKPGMDLSRELVATIEDRLWRAARFLTNKVSLGPPDAGGRVPLQIQVVEYDEAPPLEQAFSPTEQAMLKVRAWLSKLDESGDDLVVSLSGYPAPAPEGELVLSPRRGVVLLARDVTRQADAQAEYALLLKAGQAGLYSPIGGRKLVLSPLPAQLQVSLTVNTKAAATNGGPFNLDASAGFSSLEEGERASPSYRFTLTLPPVACVGFAHRGHGSSWFEGDVLIRSNATLLVKLDRRTGRPIEFRTASETGGGMVQLHFEPGAFDSAVRRLETGTAGLPNVGDTNAPLSSAVAFLAEEVCSSKYLASFLRAHLPPETAARLPEWLRQCRLAEILEPLNRLAGKPNAPGGDQAVFSIPVDPEAGEAAPSDAIHLSAAWLLLHSDELFTPRSWPWTILREACFTIQGKGRYTEQALTEIYESSETGPIGYLTVADLIGKLRPPQARKFAARGLERLSAADFRRDCRLFLAGDSVVSQCCQRLAAALGREEEEQIAAWTQQQSPARGQFIRECSRRLRAAKDQPVMDALAPTLDSFWEAELRAQVAAALRARALDPVSAFREGLAAYQSVSPDKSHAAELFAQAAAAGHAGAQYYLAMMYERGMSVPKDLVAALRLYRQSATNGYAEAGVVLGNYYSEGLAVKQDYAAAFVWYGVAAAHGHRLAETFRNGAQRKLTPPQLAEAEQTIAAILARRPAAGGTALPPAGTAP